MTLTMKADGQHQAPWVVVPDGSPEDQKKYMIELFGLDLASCAERTTYEVFLECDSIHRASYLTAKNLGGKPVASRSSSDAGEGWPANDPAAQGAPAANQKPAAPAAEQKAQEPAHPFQGVLDEIAAAESKKDLLALYTDNKEAWSNPDVAEAAKAKTKEFA